MRRSPSMSSQKLMGGARFFRVSGVLVRNSQPRRSFDHSSVLQRCFVSASLGSSLMASATMLNEPSTPLRCGGESRSEEHTSELQSHLNLVCRLLLEKKNS